MKKSRKAEVFFCGSKAGVLIENQMGFSFAYDETYLSESKAKPIAFSFPLQKEPFHRESLFPFFVGLLSEGVLMDHQCNSLKIDENDFYGRLLKTCHTDTIGAVTVREVL